MMYFKVVIEGVRHLPCGMLTATNKHGKWISGLYPYDGGAIKFTKEMVKEIETQLEPIKDKFINRSKHCYGRIAVTKVIAYDANLEKVGRSQVLVEVCKLSQLELTIVPNKERALA